MGSRWLNELTQGDPEPAPARHRVPGLDRRALQPRRHAQDGHHDVVPISIAKDARRWPASPTRRSSGSCKSTQRSQVY
jgi:hypothetical protein